MKDKSKIQETAARISSLSGRMIARCDEIVMCAQGCGKKVCNLFAPLEARKTVRLCLEFIAVIAQASSTSAILAAHSEISALASAAARANTAVARCLPAHSRSLITCISSGEQFYLNLLLRGDSAALSIARILRPLAIPVRQLFLIFAKKLQEQLTVGASTGRRER